MIEQNIYEIRELPFIPDGAKFKIAGKYAKLVLDEESGVELLYLFDDCIKNEWVSTDKTMNQFNKKYVKTAKEYNIHEIMKTHVGNWCKQNRLFYIFVDHKDHVQISYNKPVKKGYLNDGVTPKIKSGETFTLKYSWGGTNYLDLITELGVFEKDYVEFKFDANQIKFEYTYDEVLND